MFIFTGNFHFSGLAGNPCPDIPGLFHDLKELITMNQQETNAALTAINGSLTEAGTEISAKLQELQDQLANAGSLTPENEELINGIKAKAQALADIVPGSPSTETTGG